MFTISQLQQFSGIKAHTIRVWEQRYNALTPMRSEGNTRYYDNSQFRRLLNIVSLMESNYKISKLCAMTDKELFKILEEQLEKSIVSDDGNEYFISQLIASGVSFDEVHFEKIFSNCLLRMGVKDCYVMIIYPMLNRMGMMWSNGTMSPAQEHFISNIVRQKLFAAIDSLPPSKTTNDSWLLYLPENEYHEIGLLFASYIIRHAGKKVVYLGNNVPYETIVTAVEEIEPTNLLFFLVHNDNPEYSQMYLDTLNKGFKNIKIHVSGNEKLIKQLKIGKGNSWIRSVEELEAALV
ncbi:MAG: MerR family transcriptional regulator [Bacteroidota bacterium]